MKLFGIEYTMNPYKVVWKKRNKENYDSIALPKTNNEEFNFYKSLDIDNMNAEILALHPSVHAFWTKQSVKSTQLVL